MGFTSTVALRADVSGWLDLPLEQARQRLADAVAGDKVRQLPDLWLLSANVEQARPGRRLDCLNRMLMAHGLPPLALRDHALAPIPGNLYPAAPVKPAQTGPLVSVLMTVHNGEAHTATAMQSVLQQSWQALELIVVDDASTDGTWSVVQATANTDHRVQLLRLPRNIGTYAAKLIGLQHAMGEFVTCHDADDWSHPLKLERQVVPLLRDQRLVATTSCWVRVAEDGSFHARQRYPLMRWNPSSTLFRRQTVLQQAGAWDVVRTGADSEFLDRLKAVFSARAVLRVSEPLALGSHRPGSLMTDASTGYDDQGRCGAREAYTQAWRRWHASALRRGTTPWVAPDLAVAAAQRPFDAPRQLCTPLADIKACIAAAGRPGFMTDTPQRPRWLATSRAVGGIATLATLLDAPVTHDGWRAGHDKRLTGVLAWGRKPSAQRAVRRAGDLGLPVRHIEDGFLRSFRPGPFQPPLSIVVDDVGVHYDASRPSALETLLNSADFGLTSRLDDQASRARALLLAHGLSKYNDAPALEQVEARAGRALLRPGDRQRILVVDQTAGDLSIALGGAGPRSFADMLIAAQSEHPGATVYVKAHPEVIAGTKQGHYADVTDTDRVVVLRQAVEPLSLLREMDHVFVATSTLGFEALLAGKPVTCFGMPWYAGWGATQDRLCCPRRTRRRSVQELFAAAYLEVARYIDPQTHAPGSIFDVIDWLVRQRRMAGLLGPADSGR